MSKGGTTSGSTEIPAWLENAAIENINKARDVSQIGYVPYYGPDVAAFSPMQQQSMRSTGNAASAFGLAPQGFDAMAGMPQAQTFAGGIQGYSSAPLYEQSLDKLFANAPAQYRAMNDMFIDPFTGSRPRSGYGATPMQTSQMSSGGGGGNGQADFVDQVHADRMAGISDGGEIYGVNREYNPYKYSMPTKDISGDGVVDYRDMSFGEDGRRDVGWGETIGNAVFGGPERMFDAAGRAIFNMSGQGDPSMTPEQSMRIINEGAARYEEQARAQSDAINRQAGIDANNFSGMGYSQPQVQDVSSNLGGLLRGQALDDLNSQYALQTGLRDEELYLENQAMINRATEDRERQVRAAAAQRQAEAALLENIRLSAATTPVAPAVIARSGGNDGPKGNNNWGGGGSKVGGVDRGSGAFSGM